MPTYVYRCKGCGCEFERVQKMTEEPIKKCDECGGEVSRLLFPVGIVFKGSGFHVNDYTSTGRKGSSASKSDETPAASSK